MNEDQFRKMLDALVDGLWYDISDAGDIPLINEEVDLILEAFVRHIGTGVRGTPAEAWLTAWKEKKPPTYEPAPGQMPTTRQLLDMPRERRNAFLKEMGDRAVEAGFYDVEDEGDKEGDKEGDEEVAPALDETSRDDE